ncbi:3-ketoacyl-acyl carrier protein reductase [Xylaria sp. CBS 124048]|nr:3-ketoacyl-acyl carrier protein reductase [Xylaria sp. CBS 124048]
MTDDYTLPLSGKLAVVTGGSRGIGEAIAMELARRGASVVLTYVSPQSASRANSICARIEALPHKPSAHSVRVDLSTLTAPDIITSSLLAWRGQEPLSIDILINNAGVENIKGLGDITVEDYNAVFDLNVRGVILLTQALLPYFHRSNGRIVNISSVGARSAFKNLGLYCASKAALEGLTRCWAAELGCHGTTVNCVSPGPVASELLDNIPPEIVEMQKATTPLGNRLGTVEEIANVVASLAGKDGSWITGQVISASGGYAVY